MRVSIGMPNFDNLRLSYLILHCNKTLVQLSTSERTLKIYIRLARDSCTPGEAIAAREQRTRCGMRRGDSLLFDFMAVAACKYCAVRWAGAFSSHLCQR
jgi:hypothetical protein